MTDKLTLKKIRSNEDWRILEGKPVFEVIEEHKGSSESMWKKFLEVLERDYDQWDQSWYMYDEKGLKPVDEPDWVKKKVREIRKRKDKPGT